MQIELVYKEKSNRDATDKLQEHYYISPSWRGGDFLDLYKFSGFLGFVIYNSCICLRIDRAFD